MIVFVSSPYGGKEENVRAALNYCLMEHELGNTPYAPHCFLSRFLDEPADREAAMEMGLEMLERCDELHVWGNRISPGMQIEIEHAELCGIPVKYMEVIDE